MNEKSEPLVDFTRRGRIDVGTIHVSSVLSAINITAFGAEVLAYIAKRPGLNLLLDFQNVDYLSSAVLTELLKIKKSVLDSEGRLRLCGLSKTILEVFEITNLDKLFDLHQDDLEPNLQRFERSLDIAIQDAAWKDPQA